MTKTNWPTLQVKGGWKLETFFGHSNPFRVFLYAGLSPRGQDEPKYVFIGGGNNIEDALDEAEKTMSNEIHS